MVVPRKLIMLAALTIVAHAPAAVATAQAPPTNAAGGQYTSAVPGGGGNREEEDLVSAQKRGGGSGVKSVAGDSETDGGAQIGLLLPLTLIVSLIVALPFTAWRNRRARPTLAHGE